MQSTFNKHPSQRPYQSSYAAWGLIAKGVGELIVAVPAQVAEMERERICERTSNSRNVAKASLAATGKTHRGKDSLRRPALADAATVSAWRTDSKASIATTAKHFNLSDSTVKRYCLVQSFTGWKAPQTA